MKKSKTMTAVLALSLLVGGIPAFADEGTSSTATTESTTVTVSQAPAQEAVDPSSVLYSLKELLNQIKLLLTFNDNEKADMLIKQANEKISELEVLKANGSDKYDEEYSKKINDILKKTDDVLKTASEQIEKEDKETQDKEKQEIEKKHVTLTEVEKHSITVLKANLKKNPENKGLMNAIDKQQDKSKAETSSQEVPNTNVQPSTEQTATGQQSVEIVNTAQSQISSDSNTTVNVQSESEEENNEQKKEVKEKKDNGLHLGQLKHGREPHEHQNK